MSGTPKCSFQGCINTATKRITATIDPQWARFSRNGGAPSIQHACDACWSDSCITAPNVTVERLTNA